MTYFFAKVFWTYPSEYTRDRIKPWHELNAFTDWPCVARITDSSEIWAHIWSTASCIVYVDHEKRCKFCKVLLVISARFSEKMVGSLAGRGFSWESFFRLGRKFRWWQICREAGQRRNHNDFLQDTGLAARQRFFSSSWGASRER